MQSIVQKIETLIIAEISGSITHEEKMVLNDLMTEYPQVRDYSASLYKVLLAEKLDMEETGYEHTPPEERIAQAEKEEKKRKLKLNLPITLLGCFLVSSVLYFYFSKSFHSNSDEKKQRSETSSKV